MKNRLNSVSGIKHHLICEPETLRVKYTTSPPWFEKFMDIMSLEWLKTHFHQSTMGGGIWNISL